MDGEKNKRPCLSDPPVPGTSGRGSGGFAQPSTNALVAMGCAAPLHQLPMEAHFIHVRLDDCNIDYFWCRE